MKLNEVKAPFLTYDEIRPIAKDFLGKFNKEDNIPVPIEEIAEFKLNFDIISANSLRSWFGIDGWI